MDALRAIEFQHKALLRMMAALFAIAGIVPVGAVVARLPEAVRAKVLRVLLPIESSTRRLVFFLKERLPPSPAPLPDVARKNACKTPDKRDVNEVAGSRAPVFNLFDRYKHFSELTDPRKRFVAGPGPRVLLWDDDWAQTHQPAPAMPERDPDDAQKLGRRMQAVMRALGDMEGQARRLQRIMEGRKSAPPGPGRRGPIRPGWPPGRRATWAHEVDDILVTCARMANERPPPLDTS